MCDLCLRDECHSRCPNYKSEGIGIYCGKCGEEILVEEEFIENEFGDVIHFDCIGTIRELLEWIGIDIKQVHK